MGEDMKKKKIRIKKLKLTIFILIILSIIFFAFNIFGIREIIMGNKIQKEEKDGYDITTIEGNNISIPEILKNEMDSFFSLSFSLSCRSVINHFVSKTFFVLLSTFSVPFKIYGSLLLAQAIKLLCK